jgi:O-antigen ligase
MRTAGPPYSNPRIGAFISIQFENETTYEVDFLVSLPRDYDPRTGRVEGGRHFVTGLLAAVLAVTLQVQATLPLGGAGLRIALSDLLLPLSLVYFGRRVLTSPGRLQWRMPGVGWWLLGITLTMSIALLIGYERLGRWSWWALFNKWGGWFALISYFVIGGALVRLGGIELRAAFIRYFLACAAIIAFLNTLALPWLLSHYTLPIGVEFDRASGAMQNSNAFGFLMTASALLVIATEIKTKMFLPPLLAGLWFSSSRGAFLAFMVGVAIELVIWPRRAVPVLKAAAIALLAVVVITAVSLIVGPHRLDEMLSGSAPIGFLSSERLDLDAATIRKREAQDQQALSMFADAPILGHGLGYFIEKTGTTLHNSLLWLIIETGLIGTAVVTGFLGMAVYSLYLGREDPFLLGMVAVSVAFMVMSVTGEFLYQRHLWILLGMALAVPPTTRGPA